MATVEGGEGVRIRDALVLSWLTGMALVAVSIAWGRASLAEWAGFANRYAVLAGLGMCGVYLACARLEGQGSRRWQSVLAILALVLLAPNMHIGLSMGAAHARVRTQFTDDLRGGLPARELARRYWPEFYFSEGGMATKLDLLSARGWGPWGRHRGAITPPRRP